MKNLPSISIVIPTYNEAKNIRSCLESIYNQDYQKSLLEVLVVDGGSDDDTVKIAKQFEVKCIYNRKKLAEAGKMLGFKNATKELFLYLDADIELACKDWLKKMIYPIISNPKISGSFTKFLPRRSDAPLNRYLSYHKFQLDPMLEYLCPNLEDTIVEENKRYSTCEFEPNKIPPIGICIYRKDILSKIISEISNFNWVDIAVPILFSKKGYNTFAYVPNAGIYHLTVKNMKDEFRKKFRDVNNTYLPAIGEREYTYVDFNKTSDIAKLLWWIFYANLFFPSSVKGIYKSFKYKDLACMYEVPTTLLLTDYIIYLFLKNKYGRKLLKQVLKGDKSRK